MAASNEWTEWYLTPAGWVRGAWKTDFDRSGTVPEPEGWVKRARYRERMSHPFSGIDIRIEGVEVRDEARATDLEAEFGSCPEHL